MAKPKRYVPDRDLSDPARAKLFAEWDVAAGLNPELEDIVRRVQADLRRLLVFERSPFPET